MNNIVFIGGSITEGAGASSKGKSYANLAIEYLESKYGQINYINLGSSGTASNFGLFRLESQLKCITPDIIFVEFAVNDRIYPIDKATIYFEGLIRKIFRLSNNCKIVIIALPTGMYDGVSNIHKRIAYHYNIPVIDVQDTVWKEIGQGKYSWDNISIDNLHPNNLGHKIYSEKIIEELEKISLLELNHWSNKKTVMKYSFSNPKMVSYERCTFYGHWQEEEFKLNNKFEVAAVSNTMGDCIRFEFTGKYLAMMNMLSRHGGIIECMLDNKYTFNIDLYMDIDKRFETTINLMDIGEGSHELILKVSENKNPKSNGNNIVIGGFLVDEP